MNTLTLSAALAASWLAVGASQAATMTFDGIGFPGTTWVENGITATGDGDVFAFNVPNTAHLDDSGTPYASQISFTTGGLFDAASFDLLPTGFDYQVCDATYTTCTSKTYANVQVQGFLGGSLVSQLLFKMGTAASTITLGTAFAGLDKLVIGFGPMPFLGTFPNGSEGICGFPCSHFSIDNVTLTQATPAAVPLSSSAAFLAMAIGGIGLIRRRKA